MEVYGIVYLIWCKVNGRKYIGQTIRPLAMRFDEHRHANSPLGEAIRTYGAENFICGVVKYCASKPELDKWERRYISALKTKVPYGYNQTDGGDGFVGGHHSETTKAQIRRALKDKKRKPFTDRHRKNISIAKRGKNCGEQNPQYGKPAPNRGKPAWNRGKKMPPDVCKRLSEIRMGKELSATARAKLSERRRAPAVYPNLINEMNNRQLTYRALAKLMGYSSHKTISFKMRGKCVFTDKDKLKLVEIFELPIEYLLAD